MKADLLPRPATDRARFSPLARPRARTQGWLVWGFLLRLLSLLLGAELSGFAHAGSDAYRALTGAEQHAEHDCEDEEAGHECPPGCPNCHCPHAPLVQPPLACEARLEPWPHPVRQVGFVPYQSRVPHGVDPEGLYRPPRALI